MTTALADLDVLIVDAQSTGASPAFGVVLELGWGVARASRPGLVGADARWIRLPSGHQVPRQVAKLTGYRPALAEDAVEDRAAWALLRQASGSAAPVPTAIHYARFELSFLRDWAARFEPGQPFPLDAVCVHAIARRLYPELPRRSLRALAGFLGHGVDLARRSLGHVEATAFVWQRLSVQLAARGIATWTDLKDWLAQPPQPTAAPGPGPARRRYPIAAAQYRSLPDQPGVYRFLRSNGDLLYVGKAASLKKRVTSHFSGRSSREFSVEMLTQVSEIRVEVAASALEAALLENEAIKTLRPPYNLQLVASDPRVWFSDADFACVSNTPDDDHRVGPLPSASSLAPLRAQIDLVVGGAPTHPVRAAAVGVSDLWTPSEAVFVAGWTTFASRHSPFLTEPADGARARVLRLASHLMASRPFEKTADPESPEPEPENRDWDPERVARHLERAAAQAYQLYRRSRWLRWLHDSDVTYCEPGSPRARRLTLRAGQLVAAADADAAALSPAAGSAVPIPVDRAIYDRLRILTTELRRIRRDGGRVSVRPRASDVRRTSPPPRPRW